MLSVVQIATFYADHGGVEKSVSDLVGGLKDGHDVSVLCTHKNVKTERSEVSGVPVTSVGSLFTVQGRPLAATFPLELGRQKCDVAHYHLPFPLAMAAHIMSAPPARLTVATWHHDLVRNPHFNKLLQPLLESFLDRVDVIIVTAPALIEQTPVLSKRRNKCRVIPLGIAEERLLPTTDATVGGEQKTNGLPTILFVGRLVYYKGCEVLIRAMKDVKANLVLVGEGPLRSQLEELSEQLEISDRVKFAGRVGDAELAQIYRESSIFVLPSTLPTECFGLVQVEAMLCGKPVINTDLPTGVPWVSLHGETGLTVPPGDVTALTDAINFLLNDDQKRIQFGHQAKARAQAMFTLDKHVSAVSELYREFLN